MTHADACSMSVADWETFLRDRGNTYEIQYHGGGNYLSLALQKLMREINCAELYARVVQATLNLWEELDAIKRDDERWEVDPIHMVAGAAFGRNHLFIEDVRPFFNRLWQESPRPHSGTHKYIALNYGEQLPVTQVEVEILFQQAGWGLVSARVASKKGWTNTAIDLMNRLYERGEELRTSMIVEAVEFGFPKIKGLRWIFMSGNSGAYTNAIIEKWQTQLLEDGYSRKEVLLEAS